MGVLYKEVLVLKKLLIALGLFASLSAGADSITAIDCNYMIGISNDIVNARATSPLSDVELRKLYLESLKRNGYTTNDLSYCLKNYNMIGGYNKATRNYLNSFYTIILKNKNK